jgi:hypothetical protein
MQARRRADRGLWRITMRATTWQKVSAGTTGRRSIVRLAGAALLAAGFAASPAGAVELRPWQAPAQRHEDAAAARVATRYELADGSLEDVTAGDERIEPLFDAATSGTYEGTVGGSPFELTVANGKITGWRVEDLACPTFTITSAQVTTSCTIAGNDSFTCGSLGCTPAGSMRIAGAFSGNTVSGTFDADFMPPFNPCCSLRGRSFTATRGGSGGSPPAAPSNLTAAAESADEILLQWNDNSNDETEFRVEGREGTTGVFDDLGAVGANAEGAIVSGLDPATLYQFRVRARNAHGDSPYSNVAGATTFGGTGGGCTAGATTLCLNGDRFQVQATYRTGQGQTGQAQVVELTPDTGYLWFFADSNVEVVTKVLDGCAFNNRYWVFAGGLTDVEVVLTVTDTQTGSVRTYTNGLGTKYAPVQDTSAFPSCP